MFSASWFFDLDKRLRDMGLDSDAQTFDEIKQNLSCPKKLSPDEFAGQAIYVILAGGFSQKTAKKIHQKIMEYLFLKGSDFDGLFAIFHNKNKINAVCKIWNNRNSFCDDYYLKIQRLGALYAGNLDLQKKIDNKKLTTEIKNACDDMFACIVKETGLPRGYIDVVLWKACQNGLIKL